ncbi:MAG: Gfo/Idh/MocA family oxidoreductase [Candidatus Latescibacteria bacterium]|nr:Gfo/Idh/MocA family oxidoreductase [Candidatus Latescibacterota bacterium]
MKQLRWGLIGCGDISKKRVAPALRDLPNCDFVAVNRAQYHLAESFAEEFGARKWYKTWREILADDEIDAVYIATPVYLHCEQTVAAAQAGKHVLCEKPMAMNTAECDRMIDACADNNVKLGIAYYRHHYPVIARIKEILVSGEIGEVVFVQINAFEYFNPRPGQERYWFMKKEQAGGGPMFDFGCHRIEVLLNILGPVIYTRGFISNIAFEREVEDTATAFFSFESGPNGVLNVTHAAFESQDTLDIFGSEGSIHVQQLNSGCITLKTRDKERSENHPPHTNIHQPLIDNFTQALLENCEPAVGGDIGRVVNIIEEEIYRAGII